MARMTMTRPVITDSEDEEVEDLSDSAEDGDDEEGQEDEDDEEGDQVDQDDQDEHDEQGGQGADHDYAVKNPPTTGSRSSPVVKTRHRYPSRERKPPSGFWANVSARSTCHDIEN
jgi:hypothetical protein